MLSVSKIEMMKTRIYYYVDGVVDVAVIKRGCRRLCIPRLAPC